jgi:hypothetical protein
VLSHGARSLREMALDPETETPEILEAHQQRLYASQPLYHAHGLDELNKHLTQLKMAIETNDMKAVRQFFEVYRFD